MSRILPLSIFALALAAPVFGQDLDGLRSAQMRQGWQTQSGTQMTALDLQLQPEWKTYWRAPGDAGIPPQFDWTGSTNVAGVRLHWPSPEVFDTAGQRSVGYHNALILPMEITPIDPSKPVEIRLSVQMGICKDICLPAEVSVTAEVYGAGTPDLAIRTALAARPLTAGEAGVSRVICEVEAIKDGLRVTARIELPRFGVAEEVAVLETDDPQVWVSPSETVREANVVTVVAELVDPTGLPFDLAREGLTLTLISGAASVEISGCAAP
jgi:DsbC/DsbD-like thiol-disulfide interchange protein